MQTPISVSVAVLLSFGLSGVVLAQEVEQDLGRSPVQRPAGGGDPSRENPGGGPRGKGPAQFPFEFRTIDGRDNNPKHPSWGSAGTAMLRLAPADYADGKGEPAGANRPGARAVSNGVVAQSESIPNSQGVSDFVWMWGQFLDHDLDETPVAEPSEAFDIPVPQGDPWFDPRGTGTVTIPLDRSGYEVLGGVRQQLNLITAYIDASNVYGSDDERARELRTLDGTGRLKTSAGDLLPFNVNGLPNAPNEAPIFFLAGDIRANEQVALTAMHTLFVREHNHWARRIGALNGLDGDAIYEFARAIVAAEMQAITYREFLPVLLGPQALRPYEGYRSKVDPSIANAFAGAGYRFGHTMLSPQLLRVQADGSTHPAGHLDLANAFFNPDEITQIGIEPYLRGLSMQRAQEVDPYLIDDVRNFLFGPPGAGGFDLASLNIQRGRDHGLPSYNDMRQALGRPRAQNFADVSSDPQIRMRLAQTYQNVNRVDAWVGMLSEDHAPGALVGRTLRVLFADQFERLRDGDRFWYRGYLPPSLVHMVESETLASIIRRNTDIGEELRDDLFHVGT